MIELLTPPVPVDPSAPIAPPAILGEGAPADFAALLGLVAPTANAEITTAVQPVTAAVAPISAETPNLSAIEVAAVIPAVSGEMMPAPVTPTVPGQPEQVAVDGAEPVKLPTLPVDFFAQRVQKGQKPAKTVEPAKADEQPTGDEGGEDTPAPAVPAAPIATVLVPPLPASPPSQAVVATVLPAILAQTDEAPTDRIARPQKDAGALLGTSAPPTVVPARAENTAPSDVPDIALPVDAVPATAEAAPEEAPLPAGRLPEVPSAFVDAFVAQQPALVPLAMAPAPVAAPALAAPIAVALDDLMVAGASDSAWIDRLAGDITMLANGESREAHLKINPRFLGEMSIKLEIEGQRTRVHFTVETPQTLSMMTDGAPRLVQLVEANGLKLDGATVDLDQRRDGRAASDQQQQQQAAHDRPRTLSRAHDETARLVGRTRITTATERFA